MKRFFATTIAVCLVLLSAFSFAACSDASKDGKDVSEEITMFSYESYNELLAISSDYTMFGSIDINDDKTYVTAGEHSAKFHFDYEYGYAPGADTAIKLRNQTFSFRAVNLQPQFAEFGKTEYLALDVYNASDIELELFLNIEGEEETYIYASGTKLAADSWNYVRFDFKPWFYTPDTRLVAMHFGLYGLRESDVQSADLYVDNIRVKRTDTVNVPKRDLPAVSQGGMEILRFDDYADGMLVNVSAQTASTNYAAPVSVQFDKSKTVGAQKGALKATFYDPYKGDRLNLSAGYGYYDIAVHPSLLKEVAGAKTVSATCYNASPFTQVVALKIVNAAHEEERVKAAILPGETVRVVFENADMLVAPTAMYLQIENYSVTDKSVLYFCDLLYTV